ncbi:uncharacterized protein LOC124910234 [Impatiens glandulifera]|uniref:uncharacterized protein LOC124910234 n=1 Tax=Impatiens glandulifera TaxID=253017 RepID=UPI001FB0C479|nr:uncharacterized protein LOC124910234 [Impatiens glandulifera]
MKEEAISSSCDPLLPPKSSSPPHTPTPAASSAGASSPAILANAGSTDWLGNGQGSKTALSLVGSQQLRASVSTSACGSALGSSRSSCRPWERSDLLRRLSTFNPENWFGKPKAASSLACARRGWMNIDVDKIECESCNANLEFLVSAPDQADGSAAEFAKQLDAGHKTTCPWRGNSCAESLAQFPPAPPSALIGGYKDRCDGLLQFSSLPVVSGTAIEQMQSTRGPEIERLLACSLALAAGTENCSVTEKTRDEAFSTYYRAQKLISLCGWEPRWHHNIQDSEEHSAQSARNGCSTGPVKGKGHLHGAAPSKKALSSTGRKDLGKKEVIGPEAKCESRSPLLDCSLCGATARIWDFLTVSRPTNVAPTTIGIPETSKKLVLTRGVSAASGISGWVPPEQVDDQDEAGTTNVGIDLALTMGGGISSPQLHMTEMSGQNRDANVGRDLIIGQPTGSELGGHAASYESRGPSSHKRHLEEGGSTADRPNLAIQQADSVEGTVIDRDGEEVDDGIQYSAGPSKRVRESDAFDTYNFFQGRDSSGAGPSNSVNFDLEAYGQRQVFGFPSTRDSTQVSSVIAMDTVCHDDENSMESVENYPGDMDDVHFPSPSIFRNPDLNEVSEFNYSNQAQQSNCAVGLRIVGDMGVSSTNDGEELLNADTTTPYGREGQSFGISGGSVGMGASHEAEIHGIDISVHRTDSGIGDVEPVPEITENQGQTGEFAPDRGVMGDFVPGEVGLEYRQGDSQDLISRSIGRADSGSKIFGWSAKAESVESGEKTSNANILPRESSIHPSLSCNAVVYSGFDASKEEVTQTAKALLVDDGAYPDLAINGIGPPNVESNYEDPIEFDPIKYHSYFCPWVNVNVAAAGVAICSSGSASNSSSGALALCGWQLTLDALDAFQSLGHVPAQTVESESAASLYKDDRLTPSRKMLARRSLSRSRGGQS